MMNIGVREKKIFSAAIFFVLIQSVSMEAINATVSSTISVIEPPHHDNHTVVGTNESKDDHHGNHSSDDHHGNETHSHDGHHQHGIHLLSINLDHIKYPLVFSLVVLMAGLSKIGFHHADFLSSKVPESCILIILGCIVGALLYVSEMGESLQVFAPHEFFLFLLPPIILESAYSLHDRTFFENIGSILLFAVFGTILAFSAIGLTLIGLYNAGAMEDIQTSPVQIFVFSALIVAVDPVAVLAVFQEVGVNKCLYFLVFGESLLNDGVTVVIYNVMQTYNRMDVIPPDQYVLGVLKFIIVCVCSIIIGVFMGLFSAFITRYTNSVKVVEPIVVFGFAYTSYILAEMFHFSGIICIIACGLAQAQYAFCNVTNKSNVTIKFFAKVMSNCCEIIIFLFLGLKLVHRDHEWVTGFTLWTTFLCIFYRFIIVYVMSMLINRFDTNRTRKITLDEMFMISYGGLRGAVCFSLVALLDEKEFPMKNMFLTTALFVIIFTVFIQGGTIKFLVKKLQVKLADTSKEMILFQELNQHVSDHVMAGVEQVVGYEGKFYIRERFEYFDNKYLRPFLLRDCTKNSEMEELSTYYYKLIMKEHYKNLKLCGVKSLPSGSDMRALDSSACLVGMVQDGDEEAFKKQDKKLVRSISLMSDRGTKDPNWDVKHVFRTALLSAKNADNIKYHDKNMAYSQRRNLVSQLRRKHIRNSQLGTMRSQSVRHAPERTLSWDEEDSTTCQERTSDFLPKATKAGGRSYTVDLGSAGPKSPHKMVFGSIEDTVFEMDEMESKDEEEGQNDPLLKKDGSGVKKVKFFTKQPSDIEDSPEDEKAKDEKHKKDREDSEARRESAPHIAHVLRQNAVTSENQELPKEGKED